MRDLRLLTTATLGFLLCLAPVSAASRDCIQFSNIEHRLASIGRGEWLSFVLQDAGKAKFFIFAQSPGSEFRSDRSWIVFSNNSATLRDEVCFEGQGSAVQPLQSLHDSPSPHRFGVPGSGLPRCGNPSDVMQGLKVRAWATKELGESLVLSYEHPLKETSTFVLVISNLDQRWILLQNKTGASTCYRDRGDKMIAGRFARN